MAIKTLNVTKLMLAMGFKLPVFRDIPITCEKEYDTAQWFYQRLKPFLYKPTNERVRIVYVGFRHLTLEVLK